MRTHIIDELRPEDPNIDPIWEAETVRAILEKTSHDAALTTRRGGQARLGRLGLVAATVAVLIAGAFVARDRLPSSDVRPAGPVPEKIQKIDPSTATTLKVGDTLDVVADLPQTFDGDPVLFSSFTDDGLLLGAVTPDQSGQADGTTLMQSHPVMYDLDKKTFTLLDNRDRPETTQVANVSGTATAVVWAELVGTNINTSFFTLYSYDRQTGKVTTIGEFDDPDGQVVYGDDLSIAGDMAYFSTLAYPRKRGQEAVYSVPVNGSKPPSVLAAGGTTVRVSGGTLTYEVRNSRSEDEYPTFFTYNVDTGETTPVQVSSHVGEPGFCGAEFSKDWEAWCVGRVQGGEDPQPALLRIKEASGRTTEFAPFPVDQAYNAPIPHDIITLGRWTAVTVTTEDGQDRKFLVDLDTKKVTVFPENTSFGSLSPDRSMVLLSSYAGKGPGPQRIARIPTSG